MLVLRDDAGLALRVGHAQGPALGHRQPRREPRDRLDRVRSAHHRHDDDGEQAADGEGPVVVPGVVHVAERVVKGLVALRAERHHAPGVAPCALGAVLGKRSCVQQFERVLAEWLHPDRLRPVVGDVEVAVLAVDAREALRLAERDPARRLVARPGRALNVAERLRQERAVAELLQP